jgi:hypothetical protein
MNCNKSFFGLFLALLVVLPGCIRVPNYTRRSFVLVGDDCPYKAMQENINIEIKKFSNSDIHYLFDERSDLLSYKKINVVYIAICNLSKNSYIITPDSIGLEQVPYLKIDKSMKKTNSAARLLGGAAGITAGALSEKAINSGACKDVGGFLVLGSFSGISSVFGYIGIGTGIKSAVMNRRISKDIKEKTLHDKVIIKSGGHYEGIIFVKSADYKPQFTVTLHEKNNAKNGVIFDVDLRDNVNRA